MKTRRLAAVVRTVVRRPSRLRDRALLTAYALALFLALLALPALGVSAGQ